ncbi:MAG TPA: hypothetical protein VFW33_16950 [Gemmataceae bacterium]|nr:hypothetical protein [Gemmataceae bacterium]
MSVQVTIDLPDLLAKRAREWAEKTGQRLEDVILACVERGYRIVLPEIDDSPADREGMPRCTADQTYEEWIAGVKQWLRDRGYTGEPIGAERLRQMMIEDGVDPNDNSFSRGIIEMREE